uniref:VWFA domain-containing protein n=1 Tax=Panagrellus redivivus TaxID=6233 RepID=A0A7E4VXK8_PANRE
MRALSCLLVLICTVSSNLAYETPGLEVVILIKATNGSVDSTYFSSEIVPLIETISKELIFPEDVSTKQREFARISVSVGGTSDDWPIVSLRNQSRSEFLASLKKLNLAEGNANVGNTGAIKSAVETLYASSVAIYRLVVLLTDEVLMSDSESDDAKRLLVITDHRIYIIGIPSIQNPIFTASLPAAFKLTAESDNVFRSISEALSRPTSSITDVMISFDDLLNDRLVFILPGELPNWHVKPSNTYNVSHGGNVYDKLVQISQTPDFQYLDIVLLTQADVFPQNTTNSMFDLADQPNVNVFVQGCGDPRGLEIGGDSPGSPRGCPQGSPGTEKS